MKRVLILLTTLLVLNISVLAQVQHTNKIKLAMSVWQGWYVINVADQKGFWDREGLDVEVLNLDTCYNMMEDMKKNNVDMGIDMIGTWFSNILLMQESIYILGAIDNSYGGDMLISRTGELKKGSSIYVYSDMLPTMYFLDKYLETKGLKITDFKIFRYDSDFIKSEFEKRNVDIVLNYGDNARNSLSSGGIKLCDTSKFKDVMPEGVCIFINSYNNIGKENIDKFWKGYCKALEWSSKKENSYEVKEIIKRCTLKNENLSDDDVAALKSQVYIYNYKELKEKNTKTLTEYSKNIDNFCLKYNVWRYETNFSQYIKNDYFKK